MRGHAHECKPCRDADRRHELRHREMAQALRSLKVDIGTTHTPTKVPLSPTTAAGFNTIDSPIRTPPSQRRNGSVDENDNMVVPLRKREKKEIKRAMKAFSRNQAVTTQEVERIWKILHPDHDKDAPLLKEHAAHAYHRHDAVPEDEDIKVPDFTDEVERILRDLKPNGFGNLDKAGKAMFKDLKDAVSEDLVQFYQEGVGIAIRREGYLRWVGRSAIKRDLENYEVCRGIVS